MSTTSSPMCPARSATPVLNDEDAQLQAFFAATKREAQEKWERLRLAKASEVVERVGGEGSETIGAEGNVQEDVAGVEKEVIPKIEARPRKVMTRMVAGLPRSREVIPIISIPKKRRIAVMSGVAESSRKRRKGASAAIIVDSDSDSLPIPFPNPCERCLRELLIPPEGQKAACEVSSERGGSYGNEGGDAGAAVRGRGIDGSGARSGAPGPKGSGRARASSGGSQGEGEMMGTHS
ncbi:hypothetical protein GGU11DRAFT_840368 [Lentinula aff. detonsa]|nr:hypothetical protein GGU11DRAFT_840368 [Lentinula aff. detonsa]